MDEFNVFVYFLKNHKTGIIKIGKTKDFEKRYKVLCREEKCELEVLLIVYAEDTEQQLHSYFSESRAYKNEWFKDDDRIRELIEVSKEAGCLVFPEGAPYRDLPVDMRREVKKQGKDIEHLSGKVTSLSQQLNQARYKRDEYKKLSSSAGYYKSIVEEQRERDKKEKVKREIIYGTVMCVSILLAFPIPSLIFDVVPAVIGRAALLLLLVSYIAASLEIWTHIKSHTRTKPSLFEYVSFGVFFLGTIIQSCMVVWIFILGE